MRPFPKEQRTRCFAVCFIGVELRCRDWISRNLVHGRPSALKRSAKCFKNRIGPVAHRQAGRLGGPDLEVHESTIQIRLRNGRESRRPVGIERQHDLVLGLERSYKSLKALLESYGSHMNYNQSSSWPSLAPNKLVEWTPPRCALRRHSPAR